MKGLVLGLAVGGVLLLDRLAGGPGRLCRAAKDEQSLSPRALLARVAETYRRDRALRMAMTEEIEVGGYPAPHRIELTLEFRDDNRVCISSKMVPGGPEAQACQEGNSVWQRNNEQPGGVRPLEPGTPDRRGAEHVIRLYRMRYHDRFAELDKVALESDQIRYRQLRIGKQKHRCGVVRIKSPWARRAEIGLEDLWIDLDTFRVVRNEIHERAGSPTFKTTIVTWQIIEPIEGQ